MGTTRSCAGLLAAVICNLAFAQFPRDVRVIDNVSGDPTLASYHGGISADVTRGVDLDALVAASDIIVSGYYGAFIAHAELLGYDRYGARLGRTPGPIGISNRPVPGIPVSDYAITVEEVFKGAELIGEALILRVVEGDGQRSEPDIQRHREGRHLFFLALNPDGKTVGLHGPMFDMRNGRRFHHRIPGQRYSGWRFRKQGGVHCRAAYCDSGGSLNVCYVTPDPADGSP